MQGKDNLKSVSDEAKKLVLGSLLNKADAPSKKALSVYSFSASYKTNLKDMKTLTAVQLEPCAKFLGFQVRDGEKKLYTNKQTLCDRMILKIESLFNIECEDCNEVYCNELGKEPLLICRLCLQGSHDCEAMAEKAKTFNDLTQKGLLPVGGSWLCYECSKKNETRSLQPPQKSSKKRNTNSLSDPLSTIKEAESEVEGEENDDEDEDEDEDRESPRRGRNNDTENNPQICREYTMRKCPHGLTGKRLIDGKKCQYQHPIRCRFYSNFGDDNRRGCRNGKKCTFFHPKLCRNSVANHVCLNSDCGFHHLKGTARNTVGNINYTDRNRLPQQQQPKDTRRIEFNTNKSSWPHLGGYDVDRMGSLNSLNTPYPPTVGYQKPSAPRQRKDSTSERDSAFLEKLMENMKNGIITQMNSKMEELRGQIPALVQETQRSQLDPRSRQTSSHQISTQFPQPAQFPAQVALPNQPMRMPMPLNFIPNYQGSCY